MEIPRRRIGMRILNENVHTEDTPLNTHVQTGQEFKAPLKHQDELGEFCLLDSINPIKSIPNKICQSIKLNNSML